MMATTFSVPGECIHSSAHAVEQLNRACSCSCNLGAFVHGNLSRTARKVLVTTPLSTGTIYAGLLAKHTHKANVRPHPPVHTSKYHALEQTSAQRSKARNAKCSTFVTLWPSLNTLYCQSSKVLCMDRIVIGLQSRPIGRPIGLLGSDRIAQNSKPTPVWAANTRHRASDLCSAATLGMRMPCLVSEWSRTSGLHVLRATVRSNRQSIGTPIEQFAIPIHAQNLGTLSILAVT